MDTCFFPNRNSLEKNLFCVSKCKFFFREARIATFVLLYNTVIALLYDTDWSLRELKEPQMRDLD